MLYNTLILPHISYCNIVWGNSGKTKVNPILLLQKKAIRICTSSGYLSKTKPLFHRLKTLTTYDIHTHQTALFMQKFNLKLLPEVFLNFFQHNANVHKYPTRHSQDFHLSNPKILLAHKSIRHNGPDVWNALPTKIKKCKSLCSFKSLTKKHLISQYAKR